MLSCHSRESPDICAEWPATAPQRNSQRARPTTRPTDLRNNDDTYFMNEYQSMKSKKWYRVDTFTRTQTSWMKNCSTGSFVQAFPCLHALQPHLCVVNTISIVSATQLADIGGGSQWMRGFKIHFVNQGDLKKWRKWDFKPCEAMNRTDFKRITYIISSLS